MAARYTPGTAVVGGDWYDVFTLPSGELGIVMGDVAGQGLRAAVIMGRMRSALRAYALETDDPARVLDKLDHKMQHFELGAMATVLYAVCDPGFTSARIASAGHWPPVLAAPGHPTAPVAISQDILIGVDDAPRRRTTRVDIPPGAVLCLYTDGLIERRDTPTEVTLTRLCEAITLDAPDQVCAAVMNALVGRQAVPDDVALLTVRRAA
jgi:serine phosphatase RsbU (regulator of sigma subunit)